MWFKNLSVYRFTRPFELTAEQLETQLETCAFGHGDCIVIDLHRQLSSRRHDQHARLIGFPVIGGWVSQQVVEDPGQEGDGFTRPGLGLTRNIFACDEDRKRQRLNRRAIVKSLGFQTGENLRFQPHLGEFLFS